MKNILFISGSLSFGGAAKILSFVAESLHNRGYRVGIVNIKNTQNVTTYERKLHEDIAVFLPKNQGRKKQIFEIRKIAKDFGADVIIGFTTIPNIIAKIVGSLIGVPSIMSERGDPTRAKGKSIKAKIALNLINGCKGGVFQTEGARDFYGRRLRRRGVIIPNPIFINGEVPFVQYAERQKTVVSVGRLDNWQKRYDVMLDAFKLFSEKHPDYILKLYGKGLDEEQIKSWVNEKGLGEKVKFLGLTTQPMQDIARDGMFLITSDFEGISNSLLEAMATGLPCVSTDHTPGGARLLIKDHENGLLAPIGDSQVLADAMCEFADNPELAEKCGENAKDVINRFAPEKIADMWEEYLCKVIKKGRKGKKHVENA